MSKLDENGEVKSCFSSFLMTFFLVLFSQKSCITCLSVFFFLSSSLLLSCLIPLLLSLAFFPSLLMRKLVRKAIAADYPCVIPVIAWCAQAGTTGMF